MTTYLRTLMVLAAMIFGGSALAQDKGGDYKLGPGDNIRIIVFQNPDLTIETRVAESGSITYPLIGQAIIGGLTLDAAERKIAAALKDGGFVQQPQVNLQLLQVRGNQVAVLGHVLRPGRYPLETFNTKVSEMLAIAGGIAPTGADSVIIVGTRDGKTYRREVDIPALFLEGKMNEDLVLAGGDAVYVHRAPMFFIYGEVQRPGSYRIERGMTLQQALVIGGGPNPRGTEWGIKVFRRNPGGQAEQISPDMQAPIQTDDVIYVRESIF